MIPLEKAIFIEGELYSKKNSKIITSHGKIISSKKVREYERSKKYDYFLYRDEFLSYISKKEKPYKIGFYIVRKTKRKFDYINLLQLVLDMMVTYKWIEDDDADTVIPVILGYEVNKDKAGVYIQVL